MRRGVVLVEEIHISVKVWQTDAKIFVLIFVFTYIYIYLIGFFWFAKHWIYRHISNLICRLNHSPITMWAHTCYRIFECFSQIRYTPNRPEAVLRVVFLGGVQCLVRYVWFLWRIQLL